MRPEILFPLFAPISTLKGVGPKNVALLERIAGPVVRDVLFTQPQSLMHRRHAMAAEAVEGETQIFDVTIISHVLPARANQPWRIVTQDLTGFVTLVFFRTYGNSLATKHPVGARRMVSGKVERFGNGELQIAHPEIAEAETSSGFALVEPIYPATADLPAKSVRRFVLEALTRAPDLAEWQDHAWLTKQKWPSWREAMQALHHPTADADLTPFALHRARLAFDELLAHQLALAQRKAARRAQPAPAISASALAQRAEDALPFRLTGAQVRALSELRGDLSSGERMSRLIQGDVGSGKTVVAMLAMVDAAATGLQSALMAPTEILARQHFETIASPLEAVGLGVVLLTGRDKGAARAAKLSALIDGTAMIAVGTHALFQDDVAFKDLALTVIDEQHRFGVSERARLQAKGQSVHLLAMSATPIPRTLELTVFGDLDVSRIDEKPPGRTPVTTRAAPTSRLPEIVARLRTAIASGAQAFWICPMVSEDEFLGLAAAESRAVSLTQDLGPRVGLVHGRLPPAQKDQVMADFADGKLSVLVATTVVEVGVNVPRATIMVIEQAERFGLAQLHQLRGRVGRGLEESSCVLLYDPPLSDVARERLDILRRTDDGFVIAEKDLELRGGGDPLGLKQSGFPAYRFADPIAHRELIAVAADDARLIMARDHDLTSERGRALRVLQELFDWRAGGRPTEAG